MKWFPCCHVGSPASGSAHASRMEAWRLPACPSRAVWWLPSPTSILCLSRVGWGCLSRLPLIPSLWKPRNNAATSGRWTVYFPSFQYGGRFPCIFYSVHQCFKLASFQECFWALVRKVNPFPPQRFRGCGRGWVSSICVFSLCPGQI